MAIDLVVAEQSVVDAPPELFGADGHLDVYPDVVGKDYFQITITKEGRRLQARGYVGVIPLNDQVTLHVEPRVPLANLSYLLSYVGHVPVRLSARRRSYDTDSAIYPTLLSLYASELRAHVELLAQDGLVRRYYARQADYVAPTGRVLVGRTLQTAVPRALPSVSAAWYERSNDTPENQALLGAVRWLARFANRHSGVLGVAQLRRIRQDLNRADRLLTGISEDREGRYLRDPVVLGRQELPSMRQAYRPALDLALTILHGQAVSIDSAGHSVRMDSLLVNMDAVFEEYVRRVLQRAAERDNWPVRVLDGNREAPGGAKSLLFEDPSHDAVETKPDIALETRERPVSYPVVADAKYKPAKRQLDREHINQVVTYAVGYSAPVAVIVQPQPARPHQVGLRLAGRVAGLHFYSYAIALDGDLAVEEANLVNAFRSLI